MKVVVTVTRPGYSYLPEVERVPEEGFPREEEPGADELLDVDRAPSILDASPLK